MPIRKINPDGTLDLVNSIDGRTATVRPEELVKYGLSIPSDYKDQVANSQQAAISTSLYGGSSSQEPSTDPYIKSQLDLANQQRTELNTKQGGLPTVNKITSLTNQDSVEQARSRAMEAKAKNPTLAAGIEESFKKTYGFGTGEPRPLTEQEKADLAIQKGIATKQADVDKNVSAATGILDSLKTRYNLPDSSGNSPNPKKQSNLAVGSSGLLTSLGIPGMMKTLEAKGNLDVDAKEYKRLREGFAASLKQVTGDTGVMTDPDYIRIANILPDFNDNPETARAAWEEIDKILASKSSSYKPTYDYRPRSSSEEPLKQGVMPPVSQAVQQPQSQQQMTPQEMFRQSVADMIAPKGTARRQFLEGFAKAQYTPSFGKEGSKKAEGVAQAAELIGPTVLGMLGRSAFGKTGSIVGSGVGQMVGDIVGENVRNVAGIQKKSPQQLLKETATRPLTTAAITGALETIINPTGMVKSGAGKLYDIADKSGKITVSGEKVADAVVNQFTDKVSAGLKTPEAQNAVSRFIEEYSGKTFGGKMAMIKRAAEGEVGWLESGSEARGVIKNLARAAQRNISQQIKQQSFLAAVADKIYSGASKVEQVAKLPIKIGEGILAGDIAKKVLGR